MFVVYFGFVVIMKVRIVFEFLVNVSSELGILFIVIL